MIIDVCLAFDRIDQREEHRAKFLTEIVNVHISDVGMCKCPIDKNLNLLELVGCFWITEIIASDVFKEGVNTK